MPLKWMDSQTTLTEICNAFRTDDLHQSSARVCGEITEGRGRQLYACAPLPSARATAKDVAALVDQSVGGAELVRLAMINEFGSEMTEAALRNVCLMTKRHLSMGVTCGDLELLHKEATRGDLGLLRQEYEELLLQALNDRVSQETAEEIAVELAANCNARGLHPYCPVRWVDGDQRPSFDSRSFQCTSMQFHEEEGTLTLTLAQRQPADSAETLEEALTGFIHRHFGDPGRYEFLNIANNILSYLPWREATLLRVEAKMRHAVRFANLDGDVRTRFTLSMSEHRTLGVLGETSIPYRKTYRFVRRQDFEITAARLRSPPAEFDARANLRFVSRSDTLEIAN